MLQTSNKRTQAHRYQKFRKEIGFTYVCQTGCHWQTKEARKSYADYFGTRTGWLTVDTPSWDSWRNTLTKTWDSSHRRTTTTYTKDTETVLSNCMRHTWTTAQVPSTITKLTSSSAKSWKQLLSNSDWKDPKRKLSGVKLLNQGGHRKSAKKVKTATDPRDTASVSQRDNTK